MRRYKSKFEETKSLQFKTYEDFLKWYQNYKGRGSDKMTITLDNIDYESPIQLLHAYEE